MLLLEGVRTRDGKEAGARARAGSGRSDGGEF